MLAHVVAQAQQGQLVLPPRAMLNRSEHAQTRTVGADGVEQMFAIGQIAGDGHPRMLAASPDKLRLGRRRGDQPERQHGRPNAPV
jgi:hypothetical protein